MGRTYTSLTYHLIFSTKYRHKTIRPEFQEQLYQYIGGIIREKTGVLLEIGGIEDHVHIMAGFPSNISVSDMLRFIKSNSSGWVNETIKPRKKFTWQPGYGAFTVSHSQKPAVRRYIQMQERHHQKKFIRCRPFGALVLGCSIFPRLTPWANRCRHSVAARGDGMSTEFPIQWQRGKS